jgi:two-component system NtrC family sensor kinase
VSPIYDSAEFPMLGAESQPTAGSSVANPRSFFRTSIIWKLTLFVGVLVVINTALLIGAAYITTSAILVDEVQDRLTTVAGDRQEILLLELNQQVERAVGFANRSRIRPLLVERARGTLPAQEFRKEAETFLSIVRANITSLLAIWVEDDAGRIIASSGLEGKLADLPRAERIGLESRAAGGLVVPPSRLDGTYGAAFAGVVRGDADRVAGTVMLVVDLGKVMTFLSDPHGLEETGEVLIGWKKGDRIHLPLPPREGSRLTEVSAEEFPSLDAAIAGEFKFRRTTDYRNRDVLVAYRPLGAAFPGWGLIAKIDSDEAYAPVTRLRWLLLALGGGLLLLGLGASNAIARGFARPIRHLARTSSAVAAGDLNARSRVDSSDELGELSLAFNRMTDELARSHATLEGRISERTRALEALRDLLDAFFRISTSQLDPNNIDKTFDSVLRFCSELGYDLAMISLVDREAASIRAVRAIGSMTGIVGLTVRSLEGDDILAVAVRENRAIVVPDATTDPRCEPITVALSGIRGHVVLPMVSDEILGTLQVATHQPIDPGRLDLRPLETLASHTARALTGLRQLEEIRRLNQSLEQHAQELARSEVAYREQTRILQSVLDCMGDGVVVADAESRFLVFNPAAERILGRGRLDGPPEDWSRQYEIFLPDRTTGYPVEDLPLMRAIRGESADQVELYVAYPSRDDGTWIHVTGRPLRDERGAVEGGVVVFHDITRRKKAERRLAAQYETTRVLAESDSPSQAATKTLETICVSLDWDLSVFWRVDPHAQRLRCATLWRRPGHRFPQFEAITREVALEPGIGLPGRAWSTAQPEWIPDIRHDPNFPRRQAATEEGLHAAFAFPILLRGDCLGVLEFLSHEVRPVDRATLDMMASLGSQIGQFIERHQMRARVAQSEKLASLGMLSAGVAHEINNPLAYIANNLAVLERDVRFLLDVQRLYEQGHAELEAARPELTRQVACLSDECDLAYVKENLDKLIKSTRQGVKRVAVIVQNLRGFARLDHPAVDRTDVHEAIRTALEMIRGRLDRRGITIEEDFGEIPPVAGSPAQLNQVFLNLLVNALQAIETTHRTDGRITITTAAEDGEVVIEVADNGCGIPVEALPQIFDPFFTTKGIGDGTGLGLSITHGMVQDHGGRLEVESDSGQGTRFRVFLPVEVAET